MSSPDAAIQAYSPKNIDISSVYMEDTQGILIDNIQIGHKFRIVDSTFHPVRAGQAEGTLSIQASAGEISNVHFSPKDASEGRDYDLTRAIYIADTGADGVIISNSTFTNISSAAASGIRFTRAASSIVQNCTFRNNTAASGAAISIENSPHIEFRNNSFVSNSAINNRGHAWDASKVSTTYRGGAIFIDNEWRGDSETDNSIGVIFEKRNIFKGNYA